jgi:uncharacterized SAM-binding protein YcdF (DUF218 family)
MFFIFSKILLFLTSKKRLLRTTLILFYLFSNSFITDEFVRLYEERDQTYSELTGTYDVAIVLGGFSNYDPTQELIQFHSATDRLMAGLQLYKTGRAKKILISSGSGQIMNPDEKEALFIKDYLLKIGIPKEDLIIESESKNTRENAMFTAEILNKKYNEGKYILVTSAMHMPRAKRCFNKVNLDITPFSVDQQAGKRKYLMDHLLIPNVDSFARWQNLIKEWVGFIAYKFSGYI